MDCNKGCPSLVCQLQVAHQHISSRQRHRNRATSLCQLHRSRPSCPSLSPDSHQRHDVRLLHEPHVSEICEGAFTGCSNLSDVVLPSAIKSIRKDAFSSCAKLTTINLPDGVQNVDAKAFYDTGLTSVSVPPSVSHIGVLASCFFLREFKVNARNTKFCDIDGVLFNATKKILIRYPAARTASTYVIPEGTRIIGTGAFCRCHSIDTLVIPASVNYVSDNAFLQSSIKHIINNAPTPQYVGKNALRQLPPDVTLEITEPDAIPTFAASKWKLIMPLTNE